MNTHMVAPEDVMAFMDGELPSVLNDFIAGHIAECWECQQAVKTFRAGSEKLRDWQVEEIPVRVNERVLAHSALVPPTNGETRTARRRWRGFPAWSKWALGLGLTAAVVLLGQRNDRLASLSMPRNKVVSEPKFQLPASVAQEMEDENSSLETSRTMDGGVIGGTAGYGNGVGRAQAASLIQIPMIARTVALTVVVQDFAVARTALDAILERHHSYAAELTVNTAEGAPRSLQASLRVPATDLSAALSELKLLGRVENESQSGEEVTQQHADLVARLKNSRETEQRLQAILQQRTGRISDVLQVEQEIARVRGEIERMEAEQKSLEHHVDFATINLSLADVYKAQLTSPTPSFGTRLHNGLVAGYRNAAETLFNIALFFIVDGPVLLIWMMLLGLPIFFMWRRYRRSLSTI
jgi:Domain of unknown function (DUF4349)